MIVTEFSEKLKAVSSDCSIIKNIVAPKIFESLPIKLVSCGGSFTQTIAINLNFF